MIQTQTVHQIVKREFIWPFSGKKQKVDRSGSYKIQYNNPDDWEDPNQPVPQIDERNTFKYVMHELFSDDDELQKRLQELEEEMTNGKKLRSDKVGVADIEMADL